MARSESTEQIMVVNRVRQFYPWALIFSVPNGGSRDPREGARLKAEGMLVGVPDLVLAQARCGYAGLYIEMKKPGYGRTSAGQDKVILLLRRAGYDVVVAYGADEAWEHIVAYLEGPETDVLRHT